MRSVFHFVGYNLKRVFSSPKPYILFLVIYAVIRIGFGGANTYLTENGQDFQAVELFVFALSSNFFQILFILGLLFLLGDAPFMKEDMSFRLIRTTRSHWLAGQMLSCTVISAIYLLGIELCFMLLFGGQLSFQNEWSDAVRLAAQLNTGGAVLKIKVAVYFSMDVLQAGSPYIMFLLAFAYNLLLYSFLCLVIISCNLKFKAGVGNFAVCAILGEKLIQRYILPYKPLWYLSPCSIVCFGDQPITATGIAYTFLFLATLCCCLILLSFHFVKDSDLLRGDYA